jgi:hypothetical protein
MRNILALAVLLPAIGGQVDAQRERGTSDTRISLGLAIGATTGTDIWRIQGQPLLDNGGVLDTINLTRSIGASMSASINLFWFPHRNLGLSGEMMMLGGSFNTSCGLVSAARTARNQAICTSVNRISATSKAVAVSGGVFFRIRDGSSFSPYATGRLGIAITQNSAIKVEAFPNGNYGGLNQIIVFSDPAPRHMTPVMMVGFGFTTGILSGYRLRWELRDHVTGFDQVMNATSSGRLNQTPEHQVSYEHRLSLQFGGEIMLDRPRGTGY